MFYTALYGMRTGLLTRFWGSLGMALGAVSFFPVFFQFAVLWFVYLGLLIVGRVPGGRPPAWAAGEPVPWPTPGEKAASSHLKLRIQRTPPVLCLRISEARSESSTEEEQSR